jgi:galactokinase
VSPPGCPLAYHPAVRTSTGDQAGLSPHSPGRLIDALAANGGEEVAAARIVRAPGRVNLIGEHTDYNEGFVLPVAIDLEVRLALVPTGDSTVTLTRLDTGERRTIDVRALPAPGARWIDYVAGMAWSMAEAGLATQGFLGVLASTVPIGAGLSSSAALELASAWALSGGRPPAASAMDVARLAQRAENVHVGVRCGLMDQFASACGQAGHALLLDCRSLEWRPVRLPGELALVVIHTGVPRSLGASAYNERRAACERAVAAIAGREPQVRSLRDVDERLLERHAARLDEEALRRARHVVAENRRVLAAVEALEGGDHAALGPLFSDSHASLRDLYEVSSPELDALVAIATRVPGVVASRMTGAGFGGCTVTLVQHDAVGRLRERVERDYPAASGRTPTTWVTSAADGAGILEADAAGG